MPFNDFFVIWCCWYYIALFVSLSTGWREQCCKACINIIDVYHRIKMHEERKTRQKAPESRLDGPVPRYILDREEQTRAKVLSNTIKQKRKEKAVIS